ncbi:MAG: hypothetical protein ACK46X_07770 [Candidatus Sericytochromatia bacterium]
MPDSTDWYRRTTWTDEDRQAFFGRLLQSQSTFHKAQYARIQADALWATGDRALVGSARDLYVFVVREYAHEESQLLPAQVGRATCSAELDDREETLEALLGAVSAHRSSPGWHPSALVKAGELAVRDRHTDAYPALDEALSGIMRRRALTLPSDLYAACYALAFMAEQQGDRPRAQAYAHGALRAMAMSRTNDRRLPPGGLVRQPSAVVHERLLALAGPGHLKNK